MEPFSATPENVLPSNVRFLDPSEQLYAAMLEGWRLQQHSRHLNPSTIKARHRLVQRFQQYTDAFPWQWKPDDLVEFSAELSQKLSVSTLRQYQTALQLFLEYVTDQRYGWVERCEREMGSSIIQICDEWNTVSHATEYEGRPSRRPFTFDEIDRLFEYVEQHHAEVLRQRRKGSLAAARDAVMVKVAYAFGLRRTEVCRLDINDFRRNPDPKMKHLGRFGVLHVRFGKAANGGPPRRRLVFTVPEVSWIVEVLEQYLRDIRTLFNVGAHPALFPTERVQYMGSKDFGSRFQQIVKEAGLPVELSLHHLRHTYATNLAEYGYDPVFIQQQLGHAFLSTTAIYTHVSSDFKNHQLQQALERLYRPKEEYGDQENGR